MRDFFGGKDNIFSGAKALSMAFVIGAVLLCSPSLSFSGAMELFKDGQPLCPVSTKKIEDDTYSAIGEMARALGFSASKLNDGLIIEKGSAKLQVIPNAAAVWLGYEILPLQRKAFVEDGRWWMDRHSAITVMEKLLEKTGDKGKLSWEFDAAGSGPPGVTAGSESEDPKTPPSPELKSPEHSPIPQAGSQKTPEDGNSKTDEFSFRWGVHEDRIRLVVQSKSSVPFKLMDSGVEMVFPGPQKIGLSPDPAVSVRAINSSGRWVLTAFAKGWTLKVFELSDPHRFVADFMRPPGVKPGPSVPAPTPLQEGQNPQKPQGDSQKPLGKPSPPQKKRPLVVVDAGHGGKDPGARGSGYKEKDLALQIAKRLAKNIKALGFDAKLTRNDDRYLLLKTRTELANKWNADAFVSVHLNALPPGRHARGMEIYIMALPTDKDAMNLAKIENAELAEGSDSKGEDKTNLLLSILGDMQQNHKVTESSRFADVLFKAGKNSGLPVKRVAQAPFFVLRGAAMPAVLVETGFITEPSEAVKLADPAYQEKMAKSLAQGIVKYLK